MKKVLSAICCIIITSLYIFPFEFTFLPGYNTKMILSGMGALWLGLDMVMYGKRNLRYDIILLSIIAVGISLMSLVTMMYNNTGDGSFLSYPISILVWIGGAYFTIRFIKVTTGNISIEIFCNYFISVCTIQCIIAYLKVVYPAFDAFIDSFLGGEEAFMGKAEGRLYGIGAALDVAGFKFAAASTMIGALCVNALKEKTTTQVLWYIFAFIIITVIGNMIARSTIIGTTITLIYIVLTSMVEKEFSFLKALCVLIIITLPLIIYLYNYDIGFRSNIRFGFEGFFSLFETGKWQTGSNDILFNHMIVFPDNLKTWLIGDGYAANPTYDTYYIGEEYHGFYKGTDIGYIRFLFYFGIMGCALLIGFICTTAVACMKRFPNYSIIFLLVLLVNLIEWVKVSTDLFSVFAPFICISTTDNNIYEKSLIKGQK